MNDFQVLLILGGLNCLMPTIGNSLKKLYSLTSFSTKYSFKI